MPSAAICSKCPAEIAAAKLALSTTPKRRYRRKRPAPKKGAKGTPLIRFPEHIRRKKRIRRPRIFPTGRKISKRKGKKRGPYKKKSKK
jgi:hypothetical protein